VQLRQPAHKEPSLGFLIRQFERALVGRSRLIDASEAPAQVRARCVGQPIFSQLAALE
jgi:hypothetical protein